MTREVKGPGTPVTRVREHVGTRAWVALTLQDLLIHGRKVSMFPRVDRWFPIPVRDLPYDKGGPRTLGSKSLSQDVKVVPRRVKGSHIH